MLELTLSNGKTILIGAEHIAAIISGGSGAGSTLQLSGGLSYEVSQSPQEVVAMMEAHRAAQAG